MNIEDEKKLDAFLRKYEPVAPPAPADEMERIVSHRLLWHRWWAPLAIAASLALIGTWTFRSERNAPDDTVEAISDALSPGAAWEGEEMEEIGGEYILLAQAVSP
jgi:hypothetical protein